MERKLASVQVITEINPIPGADKIEVLTVRGWKTVAQKGQFSVGDRVVYLEADAWVPTTVAPFLTKKDETPRVYNDIPGERLRTILLKGQLSQGLVLPMNVLANNKIHCEDIGSDVSECLGIQKWEAPIPAQLAGVMRGNFPNFIRKIDQERIQNLPEYFEAHKETEFEASIKLDGSSMTAYFNEGYFGVCSRNLDLKEDDTNSFWKVAHRLNLSAHLTQLGRNLAIQGELIGEGIQGNPEGIKGQDLYVFDIWDIDTQSYLQAKERMKIIDSIPGLKSVPILFESVKALSSWNNMDTILAFSDGTSLNASVREGVVFKSIDGNTSFKVLNNQYLLCH